MNCKPFLYLQSIRSLAMSISLLLVTTANARQQADTSATVEAWARTHLAPLNSLQAVPDRKDLEPFKRIIGSARVIGFGEQDHGIHELLTFRNRLFEFLVEDLGVTAIAAETGYTESIVVDDYVLGRGELNPRVVGSVFSWSEIIGYPENRALVEWMRGYNARPSTKRKIHFYGVDLTGGRGGRFVETRPGIDAALEFIAGIDSAEAASLRQRLSPYMARFTSAAYDSLTPADKNTLTATLDDVVRLFERRQVVWTAKTSAESFARAYHNAVVTLQLNANFRAARAESNPQAQRDLAMAQNLRWVLDSEGPQGRVFLYEANWHISRGPMSTDRWGNSLGEDLQTMLGNEYVAIASVFHRVDPESGSYPRPDAKSIAAMISALGAQNCVLSWKDLPHDGPIAGWFRIRRAMQGGRIDNMVVNDAFDAVVFIDTVHPALANR